MPVHLFFVKCEEVHKTEGTSLNCIPMWSTGESTAFPSGHKDIIVSP